MVNEPNMKPRKISLFHQHSAYLFRNRSTVPPLIPMPPPPLSRSGSSSHPYSPHSAGSVILNIQHSHANSSSNQQQRYPSISMSCSPSFQHKHHVQFLHFLPCLFLSFKPYLNFAASKLLISCHIMIRRMLASYHSCRCA